MIREAVTRFASPAAASIILCIVVVYFVALYAWISNSKRKELYERAAQLPLERE